MGASRRHLMVLLLGESSTGIILGTAASALFMVGAGSVGLSLPMLDFRATASDLRSSWLGAVVSLVLALLISLAAVLTAGAAQPAQRRRQGATSASERWPIRFAGLCLLAGAAAIWLPMNSSSAQFRTLSYHVCVAVVIVTLPLLVAGVLSTLGEGFTVLARRRGMPGVLVGGTRLARFPARFAWTLGGVTSAVLVMGQVQLNVSALNSIRDQTILAQRTYGDVVMIANGPVYSATSQNVIEHLATPTVAVWVWADPKTPDTYNVVGSCAALTKLGLNCGTKSFATPSQSRSLALRALSAAAGISGSARLETSASTDPPYTTLEKAGAQLYLMSRDHRSLDRHATIASADRLIVGGLGIDSLGEQWLTPGDDLQIHQRWILLWGVLGLGALMLCAATALAGASLETSRESAPLAALYERRRWLASVAVLQIGLPVVLGATLASLAYLLLPLGMGRRVRAIAVFFPSTAYALAVIVCSIFVAGLLSPDPPLMVGA